VHFEHVRVCLNVSHAAICLSNPVQVSAPVHRCTLSSDGLIGHVMRRCPAVKECLPMIKSLFPRGLTNDVSLSILLAVQALTLFVVIPLGAIYPFGHVLLDVSHLTFALVCVSVLTRHRGMQAILLGALALLALGPVAGGWSTEVLGLSANAGHEIIAATAFAFNAAVTVIVARHVFAPGRVTGHRVQGAVLLYLNAASLFAIAYGVLSAALPGSISVVSGGGVPLSGGAQTAAMTYFSLTTITTTGFGDMMPVHPFVRSLANLEGVFGYLFPATLLARIVALHIAHNGDDR
jgi:hypothetical protein